MELILQTLPIRAPNKAGMSLLTRDMTKERKAEFRKPSSETG